MWWSGGPADAQFLAQNLVCRTEFGEGVLMQNSLWDVLPENIFLRFSWPRTNVDKGARCALCVSVSTVCISVKMTAIVSKKPKEW